MPITAQHEFADTLRERMESMWGTSSKDFWSVPFYTEDAEFSDPLVATKGIDLLKKIQGTLNDSFLLTNSTLQVMQLVFEKGAYFRKNAYTDFLVFSA